MAIEIELKAWADDPRRSAPACAPKESLWGAYVKDDEYWKDSGGPGGRELGSGVRIRRLSAPGAGPDAVVNFKRKEVRDGMEVNDEREFSVSDVEVFAELLRRLGLEPWIRKRKVGEAWNLDGITAELSLVVGSPLHRAGDTGRLRRWGDRSRSEGPAPGRDRPARDRPLAH
jgi:adenylate cyclase class 2